jgi:hypothetical protein
MLGNAFRGTTIDPSPRQDHCSLDELGREASAHRRKGLSEYMYRTRRQPCFSCTTAGTELSRLRTPPTCAYQNREIRSRNNNGGVPEQRRRLEKHRAQELEEGEREGLYFFHSRRHTDGDYRRQPHRPARSPHTTNRTRRRGLLSSTRYPCGQSL